MADITEIRQPGSYSYVFSPYPEPVATVDPGQTVAIHTEDAFEGRITTEGDSDLLNLAYSSPEWVLLDPLDGRADLFSLGLVFLQMLTGRHLLEAVARHEAELLSRQLRVRGEFTDPSRVPGLEELGATRTAELMKRIRQLTPRDVEEATRSLPEGLRPILHRALAPEREDRYDSGAELSQALRDYLWSSGRRYGRAELVAEVSSLTRATPVDLEEPSGPPKRGKGGPKGRREGPGKGS